MPTTVGFPGGIARASYARLQSVAGCGQKARQFSTEEILVLAGFEEWLGGLGANTALAITCAFNTLMGGLVGLYIRELYRRCGSVFSNRDRFGNLFP